MKKIIMLGMLTFFTHAHADFDKKHQDFNIHIADKTIVRNGDIAKYVYTAYDDAGNKTSYNMTLNCNTMKYNNSFGDTWYLARPDTIDREYSDYVCQYKVKK